MDNELLLQILNEIKDLKNEIKDLKNEIKDLKEDVSTLKQDVSTLKQEQQETNKRLDKLEYGQAQIIKQQQEDSKLLQSVFEQTLKLTEYKAETDTKFEKLKNAFS